MIKGILFDKDGTLLDFNRTWLDAYFQASEFLARSVDRPELAHSLLVNGGYIPETGGWVRDSLLASGSNGQIMNFWGEQLGQPLDAAQITGIREIFGSAGKKPVAVLADMPGFFSALRCRGIALGVATMDDERHAHSTLGKMGIGEAFDFICGADSGFGVKPEPGEYLWKWPLSPMMTTMVLSATPSLSISSRMSPIQPSSRFMLST